MLIQRLNFPVTKRFNTGPLSLKMVTLWVYSRRILYRFSLQIRSEQLAKEGWEYSPVFTMNFHAKERKMDLVRRRRWHRKMVQDDPSAPAVFHIDVGSSDDDVRITMLILVKSSATSFSHVHFFVLVAWLFFFTFR